MFNIHMSKIKIHIGRMVVLRLTNKSATAMQTAVQHTKRQQNIQIVCCRAHPHDRYRIGVRASWLIHFPK